MKFSSSDIIARAIKKQDKTRVALKKTGCGKALIDGLPFSISVESDGAASDKGLVLAISGEAVENGDLKIDMIDIVYPARGGNKTIKRKPEYYKKKDGKHIYRCICGEVKIPASLDNGLFNKAMSEQELISSIDSQIVFRFLPHYSLQSESEIMINIYPHANPLDGSVTEWINVTSDKDYFEHGGAKLLKRKGKG